MRPYYEQDGITIFHGDCREILPTLDSGSIDLVLTDPPYGISWRSNRRSVNARYDPIALDDGATSIVELVRPALSKLKNSKHVYVFGLTDWGDLPVCGSCELIWDKGALGMGDLSLPWAKSHEPIAFAVYTNRPSAIAKGAGNGVARMRRGTVLRYPRPQNERAGHPTPKPVELLRELIEMSTRFGEVVLDPYMGSGSTLLAARMESRRAIGIEIEERYCEIAAKRLQQSVMDLTTKETA